MRESLMASAPRMSMSLLNQIDDDRQVKIWLLSAVNVKDATYYRIAGRFTASGQTWQVNRRYSEFLMLRDTLVKYFSRAMDTCPGCLNYLHAIRSFDFPKKHLFVSKSQLVVNYRVKALRSFINLLASWAFSNTPKCPTCGGFAFDIVRNFVLEGAEPVGDASDMNYIRESFVVSTFTEAGRRSSLTRRNSYIPASSSQSLQAQKRSPQPQQRASTLQRRNTADSIPSTHDDHANSAVYDTFNDYLVRQPSKSGNVRSAINIPLNQQDENQEPTVPRPSSARQPPASSSTSLQSQRGIMTASGSAKHHVSTTNPQATSHGHNGSFLFYQDGVDRAQSTASSRPSVPSSTGSKRGILKNWNDVRQDRAQNDSYLSLGGSSADEETKTPGNVRGSVRTRNDARSQNDSYFSLGASSAESRETEEYGARPSSKRASTPKHAAQVRYDRSQNDSYLSLGASSASGEEEFHSHHPSVLPSPTHARFVQPPVTQRPHASATNSHGRSAPHSSHRHSSKKAPPPPVLDDDPSFVSDSFVDPSLRFDGMDPRIVGESDPDDDDDDIDIAGVMLDDEPPKRKSVSNQSLWQTWELAKAS